MSTSYLAILGGNLMACPAIGQLRQAGYSVLVVDGNPDAPAKTRADRFINVDFLDVEKTRAALSDIQLLGIIPLNDFAMRAAFAICRERRLPTWSEQGLRCATSKVAMKTAWLNAGLATARCAFSTVEDILSGRNPAWDQFPCVVKPSFSGGGSRGVFIAKDWNDARTKLVEVRPTFLEGDVVIEEFIEGTEHTLEVLVQNETPHLLSISDKENYPGSATVVQNLYFPGPIGSELRSVIEPLAYAACRAMGMTNGTCHFEVLIRNGTPFLLEVGGRPGGGLNFHPICELSTGYNYPSLLAQILTGRRLDLKKKPSAHLAWHYFPAGSGILKSVEGFESLRDEPDVVDAMLYETIGQPRFRLRDDLARPGYVLVKADSHERARTRARELIDRVHFVTESQ